MNIIKLANPIIKNDSDVLETLKRLNSDVFVAKDTSTGSDAYTFLCVKDNQRFFRKIALAQTGGISKLKMQIDWLLNYESMPHLTKVLFWENTPEYCIYDMTTHTNCKSFFNYIKETNGHSAWSELEKVLNSLNIHVYRKTKKPNDPQNLLNYIDTKVLRTSSNILKNGGEYIKNLLNYSELEINGKRYKNFNYYFGADGILTEKMFLDSFRDDPLCDIHGDLTIENLIYSPDDVYIIDPNLGNIHETYFLDLAKLLQSLHGKYEYLQKIETVDICQDGVEYNYDIHESFELVSVAFKEHLINTYSPSQIKSIFLHEIVHWLRLMMYKIRKDERRAVIYFSQLVILLNEIEGIL